MRTTVRSTSAMALSVLFVAILASPSVQAFESIPPGSSPHERITEAAASPLGWSGEGLKALQVAVLAPDFSETTVKTDGDKVILIDATDEFEPMHHCDRLPPTSDAHVFAATSTYILLQRDEALQLVQAGHEARSVAALGRALHALQDCHSHSDVGERSVEDGKMFQTALLSGEPLAPSDIRFTSFQPGHEEPELPVGDPYPHGLFAKDGPDSSDDAALLLPDGRTKYQAAYDLAVDTSALFLAEFVGRLTPSEKAAILAVEVEDDGGPGLIPSVGLVATLMLAALVVAFVRRRIA